MADTPEETTFLCPYFVRNPILYQNCARRDLIPELQSLDLVFHHVSHHHLHGLEGENMDADDDKAAEVYLLSMEGPKPPGFDDARAFRRLWNILFGDANDGAERSFPLRGPVKQWIMRAKLARNSLHWAYLEENLGEESPYWTVVYMPWMVFPELRHFAERFRGGGAGAPSYLCPFYVRDPGRCHGGQCGDVMLGTRRDFFLHVERHVRTTSGADPETTAQKIEALGEIYREALRGTKMSINTEMWDGVWKTVFPGVGEGVNMGARWTYRGGLPATSVQWALLRENHKRRPAGRAWFHPANYSWMVLPNPYALPSWMDLYFSRSMEVMRRKWREDISRGPLLQAQPSEAQPEEAQPSQPSLPKEEHKSPQYSPKSEDNTSQGSQNTQPQTQPRPRDSRSLSPPSRQSSTPSQSSEYRQRSPIASLYQRRRPGFEPINISPKNYEQTDEDLALLSQHRRTAMSALRMMENMAGQVNRLRTVATPAIPRSAGRGVEEAPGRRLSIKEVWGIE